jgi:phosphatidylethanolamine/phosphatidyl-N-methylethanolamine N-methyltransferase
MNPNKNRWNRIRYGLYAPIYDLVGRRLDRGRSRSIESLVLGSGDRVLIPGCGTGLDFTYLPPGLEITAGDISPAMVKRARARADALGIDADIRLLDAQNIDLPSAQFDVVLLHLILAVVPDAEAAIREAARVLRPGGRVGIFDKFLADDADPSLFRRAASAVANVVATDLNRRLGPLLDSAGLHLEHEEPVMFGGLFKVAVARKSFDGAEL